MLLLPEGFTYSPVQRFSGLLFSSSFQTNKNIIILSYTLFQAESLYWISLLILNGLPFSCLTSFWITFESKFYTLSTCINFCFHAWICTFLAAQSPGGTLSSLCMYLLLPLCLDTFSSVRSLGTGQKRVSREYRAIALEISQMRHGRKMLLSPAFQMEEKSLLIQIRVT